MNDYTWPLSTAQNYLVHYGTKGMQWGNRKYQYRDGSLTPAGRERYYRNLHGSNSFTGIIGSRITGKYKDGTETYTHYRNRAAKAGKGMIDADSDYTGPIGNYFGERRMRKYGKGMNTKTINAGKQIYKTERTANVVANVGSIAGGMLGKYAGTAVSSLTNNETAETGATMLATYAARYATNRIIKTKVYGSEANQRAEATIADAYERKTSRR